jgi:DNA-binding CsgD family transcriptional regulator
MFSPMKRAAELAGLRSLSAMGLPAEVFIPALLEMLHGVIPSLRNLFDWVDPRGNLVRYYFEGPIDQAVAAHYFEEFHNRREGEVMPTFHQAVHGRSVIRSAQELENPAFYRSALYNEIWRPQGLHTRLEAVVKGSDDRPLGSLVLYRGKGERSFTRDDEALLEPVARYVARGLEVPSATLMAGDFVSRRDRRAMLSLGRDGELLHLSADALKMLLLSHGGVTPDNVSRSPRREDFPTLSMLWQHHVRSTGLSTDNVTLTVENAWGRFVYEGAPMQALAAGLPPLIHVNIHQQEPRGLRLRRVIEELPLSPAQREVCVLLHTGRATADIAASLDIAPSTVADHVKKIYARLDVHSVRELSARINQQLGQ